MESPTFSWRVALKISSASYPDITLKRGLLERSGAPAIWQSSPEGEAKLARVEAVVATQVVLPRDY